MLAYIFWHQPEAARDTYENAQRSFHAAIEVPSACFRIDSLPFSEGSGYEDWYLVNGWAALGELNSHAVDVVRGDLHARAASHVMRGWGALYELVRGPGEIPKGVEWLEKARGTPAEEFVSSLPHESVWRRQLVLGPAPEFCCSAPISPSRQQI